MNNRFISIITILCFCVDLYSQYQTQILFPGVSGSELLTSIYNNYKTNTVLTYTDARIKMYKEIYNVRDSVYCVYTKHSLYLDPTYPNPIEYMVKGGSNNGINCEHTFPQSKGAEIGLARSDLHHLFPSRAAANEARSNYPFSEIDDSKTKTWFYQTNELNSKPSQFINEYSESYSNSFEPREDHKGNVARAIFYFYSMYETQSDKAFFNSMLPTLCKWHNYDSVDSLEWTRTYLIAQYQENKANPFVLDCTLPQRTYCPLLSPCLLAKSNYIESSSGIEVLPNPFFDFFSLKVNCDVANIQEISILNSFGKKIFSIDPILFTINSTHTLNSENWPEGNYFLKISWKNGYISYKKLVKI